MHIQKTPPSRFATTTPWSFRPVRVFLAAALLLAAAVVLPRTGRAQLLGSLVEGPANAPYRYYLTVEFGNGHYYDFTLRSSVASYTGYDFINAVSVGSQGTALVLTLDQTTYSFGHALNGVTINSDSNSGFTNSSYWNYWTGSATNPVAWTYSSVGEDGRTITPGQADGWVYATGSSRAPQAVSFAAVPEPSAWAMLAGVGLAGGLLRAGRRRKDRA